MPERFVLTGPAGDGLAKVLTLAVDNGLSPVRTEPGEYVLVATVNQARALVSRMSGLGLPALLELDYDVPLPPTAATIAALKVPVAKRFVVALEEPPEGVTITSSVPRLTPWPRVTVIHGEHARAHVAAAIDLGLTAKDGGVSRYAVTGPTSRQIDLVAVMTLQTPAAVRKAWKLTIDQVALEDGDYLAPITMEAVA